jgi:hypothetical protein
MNEVSELQKYIGRVGAGLVEQVNSINRAVKHQLAPNRERGNFPANRTPARNSPAYIQSGTGLSPSPPFRRQREEARRLGRAV